MEAGIGLPGFLMRHEHLRCKPPARPGPVVCFIAGEGRCLGKLGAQQCLRPTAMEASLTAVRCCLGKAANTLVLLRQSVQQQIVSVTSHE